MRTIIAIFFALMCFHAYGKNLTADEVEYVRSDIDEMLAAFEEGDATVLIAKTHSSLYPLVGGKESFKQLTIDALAQLKATGIKFLSSELKSPTALYTAGEEEICFVPRISVMEIEGTKMQSVGFMIAIRKIDSGSWSYLDGTGLRHNQRLLWQLFPALERNISLPPNYISQIQE
ncbi:MAG: hypothetical protein WA929_05915 [Pseudomonas neustonica]|tara:strand:+ start:1463 stop:1987 length:525 start_codon:yes stop_codon:yes gene_type:complete